MIIKGYNVDFTKKEIAAIASDLATDSLFGILPAMSLSKSQEENRNIGSTALHMGVALGVAGVLDRIEDGAVRHFTGTSSSQAFGRVLNNNMEHIFRNIFKM